MILIEFPIYIDFHLYWAPITQLYIKNILLYFYIYFSSKNIDFKKYMLDVMQGHKFTREYENWSSLIKRSIFYKETLYFIEPSSMSNLNNEDTFSPAVNNSFEYIKIHNFTYHQFIFLSLINNCTTTLMLSTRKTTRGNMSTSQVQ